MALVNKTLTLDITPGAIPEVVKVSEYDINRQYVVTLLDENGTFSIPSGTTAKVEGTLGGVGFSEDATISGNTITFTLTENMTAKPGDAWCKIKLTNGGKPVSSCAFTLRVDCAGVEADTVIGMAGFQEQIGAAVGEYLSTSDDVKNAVAEELADSEAVTEAIDGLAQKAPYINTTTNTWMVWSATANNYVDSEIPATGESAVHTVNGESGDVTVSLGTLGAAHGGEELRPMDDLIANEMLECVYSYIDNADKLFYGGMNARYIADCTNPVTVRDAIKNIVDIPEGSTLAEIKTIVDAITDETKITQILSKLHVVGNWVSTNPMTAVDYLLSGRKPIHCSWFAYLITSGIRYETSLFAGNTTYTRFYDWGFQWPDLEEYYTGSGERDYTDIGTNGYPLASFEAKYCLDHGYGFEINGDFKKLRTGDLLFFANNPDARWGDVGHVAIFLCHNPDGKSCTIVDVDSAAPNGENTTYPVHVKIANYTSSFFSTCAYAARLPYAGDGRCGQANNLFINEVAYRNRERTLTASNAILADTQFSEPLKLNRFYTMVIALDRDAGIGDEILVQGRGATSDAIFRRDYFSMQERVDGIYSMTLFNGRYRSPDNFPAYERLNGFGFTFRSHDPNNSSTSVGIAQTATVKWIACYEGVHHVGSGGFVPYVNALGLFEFLGPVLTSAPKSVSKAAGEVAQFSVTAEGYNLSYQWQWWSEASNMWHDCSSAMDGYNAATLNVEALTARNGYRYRCIVTAPGGMIAVSAGATLTVS